MLMKKALTFPPFSSQHESPSICPEQLMRKGSKRAPFARKKSTEILNAQSKNPLMTARISREKKVLKAERLATFRSLKSLHPSLQEDIKYLSPRHSQSIFAIKSQLSQSQNSKENDKKKEETNIFAELNIFSSFDDVSTEECRVIPSAMSIDSFPGKGYAAEPTQHSRADWFGLETQNERLKEQNGRLEREISMLKEQLLKKQAQNDKKIPCQRCKEGEVVNKNNRESKELQAIVSKLKQEIDVLKKMIGTLNQQLTLQKDKAINLSNQLRQSRQTQAQLQNLMINLREKMEKDTLQLKYLAIQQDMLMRRKQQIERSKQDKDRKGFERQSLRRMLTGYKQKIDLLRQVIAKGRDVQRMQRSEELQFSLDLSIDSTINNN